MGCGFLPGAPPLETWAQQQRSTCVGGRGCKARRAIFLRRAPTVALRQDGQGKSRQTGALHYRAADHGSEPQAQLGAPKRSLARSFGSVAISCALAAPLVQVSNTMAGLAVLAATIVVHEAGHFLAARSQGIRVQNFSIGFGPKLLSYKFSGSDTSFTLRAIPFGGFVAFPKVNPDSNQVQVEGNDDADDEEGESGISDELASSAAKASGPDVRTPTSGDRSLSHIRPDDPDLLQNRPPLDRALVISAGVIANIMLAWAALFTSVSAFGVPSLDVQPGVVVTHLVDAEGNGAKAGMRVGDVILAVDDQTISADVKSAANVAKTLRTSQGRRIMLRVSRDKGEFNLPVQAKCCTPNGDAMLGVQLSTRANVFRQKPTSLVQSFSLANKEFSRLFRQTLAGFASILTNFKENSGNFSGPIGVVSMGAELAKSDKAALLIFAADISMNLAIINSLPLPVLDGGQMFFLIAEVVRGAPISSRVQETVNLTAFFIFLAFSGLLIFGDLEKLNVLRSIQNMFG